MKNVRALIFVSLCMLLSGSAMAVQFGGQVGTCIPGKFPQFNSIQAGVDAIQDGQTLVVCPGTYPEQVLVRANITISGYTSGTSASAVVTIPAGGAAFNTQSLVTGNLIAAQIVVEPGYNVTINDITVDGSNNLLPDCTVDLVGIYYQDASGTVGHSAAINQALSAPNNTCPLGEGIFVESDAVGGTSTVSILSNYVSGYQNNGISATELGTTATIAGNNVFGLGANAAAIQNGIQVGFGAAGSVRANNVSDNASNLDGSSATGILVFASPNIPVVGNSVGNSQFGVAVVSDATAGVADGATLTSNKISATHTYDGIDVCSNSNTLQGNTLSGSDQSAIHLDNKCSGSGNNNTISGNTFNESCAGILSGTGTSGNSIGTNAFFNVTNTNLSADTCSPPPGHGKRAGQPHSFKPKRL